MSEMLQSDCTGPMTKTSRLLKWCCNLKELFGIDKAVAFLVVGRIWKLIAGIVILVMVTTWFTPEVQGFYYTFSSMIFLQTLLELGFGMVLIQFVSHEWAHLGFNQRGEIEGDARSLSRLSSLVRLGIKWYLAIAVVFLGVIGTAGYFFLAQNKADVGFEKPWWCLCVTIAFSISLIPFRCLLEGTNQIARSQQIYFISDFFASIAGVVAILYGAGLYTLAVINGISAALGLLLLIPASLPLYKILKLEDGNNAVSWKNEFWPQQWRIGVSWLSGFFMFQAFVPVMFYLHGAVIAGKMGAGIAVYNAINSFSQSWTYAAVPKMGMLSAKKNFSVLRMLIRHTYLRSVVACIVFSAGAILVIYLLHIYNIPQAKRFPGLIPMLIFLTTLIAMQLSNVETQAIRFQKREPFVINSIVSAFLVLGSNIFLGKCFGITGAAIGFALVMLLITIPWCHRIYGYEMNKVL
jgi:hypothetical protein